MVIGCPAIYLQHAKAAAGKVSIAAENCYKVPKGAFTGEISPAMIKVLSHTNVRSEPRWTADLTPMLINQNLAFCILEPNTSLTSDRS